MTIGLAMLAPCCVPAHATSSTRIAAPQAAQHREVTDETGRHVAVPVDVRRIVSLAPNLTETIYALGAQDRLVGVTNYCDYPPDALKKTKIGTALNPSLEAIVGLKPDLVLATTAIDRLETVQSLERLGIPVYATDPHTVEGILVSIRNVGDVIGAPQQGDALAASLASRLAQIKQQLAGSAPKRILFVVWEKPLITMGKNTFLADAVRWAGGESVINLTQNWPNISLEEAVRQQPDALVFASGDPQNTEKEYANLSAEPGWRVLHAVEQRQIITVSDAISRPAPRLVDAIEELARALHPDAFAADAAK
jgi:iron complex transport system substrate-binding protein